MVVVDIVDEHDTIIGAMDHNRAKQLGQAYRLVQVILVTRDSFVVQKRALDMHRFAGLIEVSAGGHVDAGETYKEAARRELQEELGVSADLTEIAHFQLTYENTMRWVKAFVGKYDGSEFTVQEEEVDSVFLASFDDVQKMLEEEGLPMTKKIFQDFSDKIKEFQEGL